MKLYQTGYGFELITHNKRLFSLLNTTDGWSVKFKGIVNENYHPAGRLVKKIPNYIKRQVFKLNKNDS